MDGPRISPNAEPAANAAGTSSAARDGFSTTCSPGGQDWRVSVSGYWPRRVVWRRGDRFVNRRSSSRHGSAAAMKTRKEEAAPRQWCWLRSAFKGAASRERSDLGHSQRIRAFDADVDVYGFDYG